MSAQTIARRFFRRYASTGVLMPKSSGNVYELFIYTKLCRAVASAGHTVHFVSPSPTQFRFRTSPGGVSNNWGYVTFTGINGNYEIRNGVEVLGHSFMRHESDIAIFRVPAGQSHPLGFRKELVLTIECKNYNTAAALKAESRKNLGMVQDWSAEAHPSQRGGRDQGCIHCGLRFEPLFVTNVASGLRPDIEGYLEAYDLNPHFGVAPNSLRARAFVTDLTATLQRLLL